MDDYIFVLEEEGDCGGLDWGHGLEFVVGVDAGEDGA